MAEYYLNPQLATGANDGSSEADAFRTWAACATHLDTNHANLITAAESVTVWTLGTAVTNPSVNLNVVCSETYPLRFVVPMNLRTPGEYSESAPCIITTSQTGGVRANNTTPPSRYWYEFVGFSLSSSNSRMFHQGTAPTEESYTVLRDCFIRNTSTTTSTVGLLQDSTTQRYGIQMFNCIADNIRSNSTGTVRLWSNGGISAASNQMLVNCTLINCQELFTANAARKVRVVNCLLVDTNEAVANWHTDSGYNATTSTNAAFDVFASITQGIDATGMFVSDTEGESRLLTASNSWGAGLDVDGYGNDVPPFDILGNPRVGDVVSVGAHEPGQGQTYSLSEPEVFEKTATTARVRVTTDTADGAIVFALYASGTAPDLADPGTPAAVFAEADTLTNAIAAQSVVPIAPGVVSSAAFTGLDPNTTYEARVVQGVEVV